MQSYSDCPARRIRLSFAVLKHRLFLKYWLPVLVWMAVIFAASSDAKSFEHSSRILAPLLHWLFPHMANSTMNDIVFIARKCCHLAEYAVFALLVWRALNQSKNHLTPWSWPKVGGTLLIVFLYAASDEFHQIFVPTRTPRIHDVVIDTIGGAIGLFALWIFHRRKPEPQK
jgi:VanZ family protein